MDKLRTKSKLKYENHKLKFMFSKATKIDEIFTVNLTLCKGQLISKAIYGLLTSPKKQMDEFVLFAFLLFTANKSNLSVRFLGESMARQSAFQFYLTFRQSRWF